MGAETTQTTEWSLAPVLLADDGDVWHELLPRLSRPHRRLHRNHVRGLLCRRALHVERMRQNDSRVLDAHCTLQRRGYATPPRRHHMVLPRGGCTTVLLTVCGSCIYTRVDLITSIYMADWWVVDLADWWGVDLLNEDFKYDINMT